ncbi:type VI secretion system baseplate subunit TssK, partial [Geomonas sp.]|uniref:type VI secretion system baseplate subunit TssK n=1 Tax=Geomonas sp. TaxID=2651584 RepID=UPI002B47792B
MVDVQRPLFWHQGLFLQPQHFQLQDRALLAQLIPALAYQTPHLWGVADLQIDLGALSTYCLKLRSGSFRFQDGTFVHFPGNAWLEPRSLHGELSEGKPLQVYLGLKRWDETGENVTVLDSPSAAASAHTRFLS